MKEVSSSTWVFQIIILFILIFAAFMALTLSYFKVFLIKNETISIIEKYERFDAETIGIINNYVKDKAYNTTGKCKDGWNGVASLDSNEFDRNVNEDKKYYYCFKKSDNYLMHSIGKQYYDVIFFYQFNLPVVGELGVFEIKGRTNEFKNG